MTIVATLMKKEIDVNLTIFLGNKQFATNIASNLQKGSEGKVKKLGEIKVLELTKVDKLILTHSTITVLTGFVFLWNRKYVSICSINMYSCNVFVNILYL